MFWRNFVTLCKKSFVSMSKRRAYSIEFKTKVIKFAEKHSNRETGRKFKIDESMVRRWLQKKKEINEAYEQPGPSKKRLRLEGAGRKPCLSTVEDEINGKNCQRTS